jgi:hypothetical protein
MANNRHSGAQPRTRKPYTAPVLREFGEVGKLTQGGTDPMMEIMILWFTINPDSMV